MKNEMYTRNITDEELANNTWELLIGLTGEDLFAGSITDCPAESMDGDAEVYVLRPALGKGEYVKQVLESNIANLAEHPDKQIPPWNDYQHFDCTPVWGEELFVIYVQVDHD